jgi:UDP-N-acetylglucosamine--N-acetylmuramyl-(pentapeptide) pyrophosphoryl-undecaprenol N-acetylglucosamine transferase
MCCVWKPRSFFPKDKIIVTGNPVRQDLIDISSKREEATAFFNLILIKDSISLGGSLGSRRINQLIEKELNTIQSQNVQIIWQCGKLYFEDYKKV